MEHKKSLMFAGIFALVFLSLSLVSAVSLAGWNLTTDGNPHNVNANINAGEFTSSGVVFNVFGTNGANAENWSTTSYVDNTKYFEVTFSPKLGNTLTISDITFDYSASIIGPASFELRYSKQSGFGSPTSVVIKTDVDTTEKSSSNTGLNIQVSSGETLTIRVFGYDFNADTNEFRVKNLKIEGTVTVPSTTDSFCKYGPANDTNLNLKKVKIKNFGEGKDSENNNWFKLDRIEIKVVIENNNNYDIDDIVLELGLFKKGSTTDIADEMFWISEDDEETELGDIEKSGDDDDELTHTFEFRINPEEVEKGDYLLKIKAYKDGNEAEVCVDHAEDLDDADFGSSDYYAEISIDEEDAGDDDGRAVVVDTYELDAPITANCGELVIIKADIYNIGDEDQEQIKVVLYNKELGINLEKEIRENLDKGESDEIEFTFTLPKDAEEKQYTLEFTTYYDYKDNKDTYNKNSEEFFAYLKIDGNCGVILQEPSITATLASNAQVGEELVVQVSITNPNEATDFIVTATGYESWAGSANVIPSILSIAKDGAGQLTITLAPTQAGAQTFNINAVYNGQTKTQIVAVNIAEKTGLLTGAFAGVGNTGLYIIACVFLVLIILIIALIVKVAGSSPKGSEF